MVLYKRVAAIVFAALLLTAPGSAQADVPLGLQYQGVLTDGFGAPLNATVTIGIGIWDAASGGALLYSETHTGVQVVGGVFAIEIGAGTTGDIFDLALFSGPVRWLQVAVDGMPLSTRQFFLSVPYALQAGQIAGLAGTLCSLGGVVKGFDSLGVPICSTSTSTIATLDPNGGSDVRLLVGPDGFPFVSYYDQNSDLKLIHCTSADCSSTDPPVILGSVTPHPYSLAIGTDGFPVVAYTDGTNLIFIHCTDVSCNAFDAPLTLDPTNNANFPSIGIGGDGFPRILYEGETIFIPMINATLPQFSSIICTSPTCSNSPVPIRSVSSIFAGGQSLALAIGNDGLPVITFVQIINPPQSLIVSTGGGSSAIKTVDALFLDQVSIGIYLGNPVILYRDSTFLSSQNFELAACFDATCQTILFVNPLPFTLPKMAVSDTDGTVLCHSDKVTLCGDITCTVVQSEATIPISGSICASIAIGADEFPVVVVNDSGSLKVFDCADPGCLN